MARSKFAACLALSVATVCGLVQADDYNAGDRKASTVKPGSRVGFRKATDAGPSPLSRWFKDFSKPKVAAETKENLPGPVATRISQREVREIARSAAAPKPIIARKSAPASVPKPTVAGPATVTSSTGCGEPNCQVCNPCQCNSCQSGLDNYGQDRRPRRVRRLARLRNRGRRSFGSQVAGRRAWGFVDAGITPHEQSQHYPYQSHEWTYYHRPYNYKQVPETAPRWGQINQVNYQSPYSNEFFSDIYKRHEETRQIEMAPTEFLDEPLPLRPGISPEEYAPEDFTPGQFAPEEFAPPGPLPKERASFTRPTIRQVSSANELPGKSLESGRNGGGIGIWKSR